MSEQGTEEWKLERVGHCTASRFKDVLATIKTGEAASRRNYRVQLVTERLTGLPVEGYKNAAMQWGSDHEAEARMAIEALTGLVVETVGFVKHPGLPWVGCSPDGLVGADEGVEIKCPYESTVHVEYMERGMPPEHKAQVQGNMWVTGRKRWYFVSYDPRMPEGLKLFVEVVERDDAYLAKIEVEVRAFLGEVAATHKRILELSGTAFLQQTKLLTKLDTSL